MLKIHAKENIILSFFFVFFLELKYHLSHFLKCAGFVNTIERTSCIEKDFLLPPKTYNIIFSFSMLVPPEMP